MRIRLLAAAFLLGASTLALAQTDSETQFASGLAAKDRGHYATAMRAWLPLANSGIAEAQNKD